MQCYAIADCTVHCTKIYLLNWSTPASVKNIWTVVCYLLSFNISKPVMLKMHCLGKFFFFRIVVSWGVGQFEAVQRWSLLQTLSIRKTWVNNVAWPPEWGAASADKKSILCKASLGFSDSLWFGQNIKVVWVFQGNCYLGYMPIWMNNDNNSVIKDPE